MIRRKLTREEARLIKRALDQRRREQLKRQPQIEAALYSTRDMPDPASDVECIDCGALIPVAGIVQGSERCPPCNKRERRRRLYARPQYHEQQRRWRAERNPKTPCAREGCRSFAARDGSTPYCLQHHQQQARATAAA